MANKVSVLIDIVTDGAQDSVKKLTKSMREADTLGGKFKVGWQGAMDSAKKYSSEFAIAAGTALVAFGVKAVGAFTETALAAGKFSDATGIAVDDASRWMEVGGDVGVGADAIQGAIQKMNKALADGKPAFEQYGVEVVRTADGVVDANATFQNALTTIGAIVDPTKRAQAAQQVFGKSYAEVSRLMEMSAGDLESALKGVSDSKVIDPSELKKARQFEAAMDALKDAVEDVVLQVGGALTPVVTDLAVALDDVNGAFDSIGGVGNVFTVLYEGSGLDTLIDGVSTLGKGLSWLTGSSDDAAESTAGMSTETEIAAARQDYYTQRIRAHKGEVEALAEATPKATKAERDFADEAETAARKIRNADEAYQNLMGTLDDRDSWRNATDAVGALWTELADPDATTEGVARKFDDATGAVGDYIAKTDEIKPEVKTVLYQKLEEGDLNTVLAIIAELQKGFDVPVRFKGQGSVGFEKRAKGGPISAGQPYLVGEQGPELVVPSGNGTVIPAGKTAAMMSGGGSPVGGMGGTTVINITTGADPNAVIAAIKKFEKSNGAAWRS